MDNSLVDERGDGETPSAGIIASSSRRTIFVMRSVLVSGSSQDDVAGVFGKRLNLCAILRVFAASNLRHSFRTSSTVEQSLMTSSWKASSAMPLRMCSIRSISGISGLAFLHRDRTSWM
ncbi:hypothetical protein ISCGN_019367 [Ixodes scapularis]